MDGRSSPTSSASSGPEHRLLDADSDEARALLVEGLSLECRDGAVCILHHEEQVEHPDRAVLYELHDRGGDTPGELVAWKANDVYVDGADSS